MGMAFADETDEVEGVAEFAQSEGQEDGVGALAGPQSGKTDSDGEDVVDQEIDAVELVGDAVVGVHEEVADGKGEGGFLQLAVGLVPLLGDVQEDPDAHKEDAQGMDQRRKAGDVVSPVHLALDEVLFGPDLVGDVQDAREDDLERPEEEGPSPQSASNVG